MTSAFLAERRTLYFVYGRGCGACEEAEPELAAFIRANPTLMVVRLDAHGPHPAGLGLKIKATPTYVFRVGSEGIMREGGMTAAEIGEWLNNVEQRLAEGEDPSDLAEDGDDEDDAEDDDSDEESE